MANSNKQEKYSLFSDYQEIRHESNAIVVGDEVYVKQYTNDKERKHIKVWKKVARIEIGEGNMGRIWFEDSNRPMQLKDWRVGVDSIVTTKAWEKAFDSLLKGGSSEASSKFKKRCVVSYATIDGVLCVVISERQKLKKQWCFRHDNGLQVKGATLDTKEDVIWVCRKNSNTVIAIRQEKKQKTDVEIPSNCFEKSKLKGRPVIWNAGKVKRICNACPWLLTLDAKWKIPWKNEEPEIKTTTGQKLIDYLEGRIRCKDI